MCRSRCDPAPVEGVRPHLALIRSQVRRCRRPPGDPPLLPGWLPYSTLVTIPLGGEHLLCRPLEHVPAAEFRIDPTSFSRSI